MTALKNVHPSGRSLNWVWDIGTLDWVKETQPSGGGGGGGATIGAPVPSTATAVAVKDNLGNLTYPNLDASGNLLVAVTGAGSGGTSSVDRATWTAGTSAGTPVMGAFDDVASATVAEDKIGIARITTNRALHTNLRDASGNELGVATAIKIKDPLITASGSIKANGSSVAIDTTNASALRVYIVAGDGLSGGVQTLGTTIEATVDGTNWFSIYPSAITPIANNHYVLAISGYQQVRLFSAVTYDNATSVYLTAAPAAASNVTLYTESGREAGTTLDPLKVTGANFQLTPNGDIPLPVQLLGADGVSLADIVGGAVSVSANGQIGVHTYRTDTQVGTWTSATAVDTVVIQGNQYPHLVITSITDAGTFSGGVITFEGSDDNSTWFPLLIQRINNYTTDTTYTLVASTKQMWRVESAGFRGVRVRLSTAITGTGSVTIKINDISMPVNAGATAVGQSDATTLNATVRIKDGSGNNLTSTANALDINLKTSDITLPVSGPVTNAQLRAADVPVAVNFFSPGTSASSLGKAEDSTHVSGDVGVMGLSVRKNTPAATSDNDGDYQPVITGADGRLWASTTIDSALPAGANVIGQVTANAGTSLNTSLLALEAGNLATIKTNTDKLDVALSTRLKPADTLAAVTSITNVVHVDDNGGSLTVDGTVTSVGGKSNNAGVPGATNLGVLPAVATAVAPTYVEGNQVGLSTDLAGNVRISGSISASTSADVFPRDGNASYAQGATGKNLTQTPDGRLRVSNDTLEDVTIGTLCELLRDIRTELRILNVQAVVGFEGKINDVRTLTPIDSRRDSTYTDDTLM